MLNECFYKGANGADVSLCPGRYNVARRLVVKPAIGIRSQGCRERAPHPQRRSYECLQDLMTYC